MQASEDFKSKDRVQKFVQKILEFYLQKKENETAERF